MNKRVLLTGGGTAGHVTPNLALLPRLRDAGFEAVYVGSARGIECELATKAGVPFHSVQVGKIRRYLSLENLIDPFRIMVGVVQAIWLVRRLRPNVVFSKGGFVSVPVVLGAWVNRVPVVAHESDLTAGLANKITLPFTARVCTSYPETVTELGAHRATHTGTPIRPLLLAGERARGAERFGLDARLRTVLVFGGSLGAQAINAAVRELVCDLPDDLQILHVCGRGNLDPKLDSTDRYVQAEYLDEEFGDAFALADVVISRAGANSLAEITALRKPALLIPLPTTASRGDQLDNARDFVARGYGRALAQEEASGRRLMDELDALFRDAEIHRAAMARDEPRDSAGAIVDILLQNAR